MSLFSVFPLPIFLLQFIIHINHAFHHPPNLTITFAGEQWQKIPTRSAAHPIFYSPKIGDDLILACNAPYPIQWNLTGFIQPQEIVKIQLAKRNLIKKSWEIALNLFFIEAENFKELGASLKISCEKIDDAGVKEDIFVFVLGNNRETLVTPKQTTVTDSMLIPCSTKNPRMTPTLHHINANGKETKLEQSQKLGYFPTEGYRSFGDVFSGQYACRLESSSISFTALISPVSSGSIQGNYQVTPKYPIVRAFSEDPIHLECLSKGFGQSPVQISVDNAAGNVTVSNRSIGNGVMTMLTAANPEISYVIRGKAACHTNNQLIKEWIYEIVPTPTLYLNNFEGEVSCLSPLTPKMVQTVRCINGMDCSFMGNQCLDNVTSCGFKKQKQFYANKDTNCWVEMLQEGINCTSVPYSHLNGLAQCTVNGLTKRWDYFVSLDFLRYSHWTEAPEQQLLRMDETSSVQYTNGSTRFFCMAVAYLFADSLSFELELNNGSRRLLEDNGLSVNISNPSSENPRKIDEFNVIGILDINLPLEAVGVRCLAPWWNTTDGLKSVRKFQTRHLVKPEIDRKMDKDVSRVKAETFYLGEKHRRLGCYVKAEPRAEYEWYFGDMKVEAKFPGELRTTQGESGEGYLEFPELTGEEQKKFKGEYKCVAKNRVGEVERRFKVEVYNAPISGQTWVYIGTVLVILIVLAIVMAALFVFMRRYNEAKALVRSLTDAEMEEFFQGRPELLEGAKGGNLEVVEFLPYKSEYEIKMQDLEFDTSEKNVLGAGEFAYVVRGIIISKQKPVAIKISKPSADVTLFKSLLSEVKIMIYIGVHENVVGLVGVCTEGIRNRTIHIATEICDLGSLDGFVRKARPTFADLINENREIDPMLISKANANLQNGVQVNTMDLINFCGQIAKGMEYLAYKSVVHADLAARNVLLTSGKICKISDFGLSKKLYECNNYVKKSRTPLPWRWMAIESLTTLTFSTSSDIWAYGVTLFEIFTLGDIPFPNEEWNKEFLTRLSTGMRMGRPKYCTQEIYSKVMACWEPEPQHRPSFSTLRQYFQEMLAKYQYGNSSSSGNHGSMEHSGPLTTTGDSLYANYDPNENPAGNLNLSDVRVDQNQQNSGDPPGPSLYENDSSANGVVDRPKYANLD